MKNKENRPISNQVDARIISLYSRDASMMPVRLESVPLYSMFEYYEALEIEPVSSDSPLLTAYLNSRETIHQYRCHAVKQTLFAFTDISDNAKKQSETGAFSKESIDRFWEDQSEPILFMTMINVENAKNYKEVVRRIRKRYPKGKYLIYFTLDYFDIIIFLRGHSFQQCAKLVFDLDFGPSGKSQDSRKALLVDSITLYAVDKGFDFENANFSKMEQFGTYMRFGVADAERMERFCCELQARTEGRVKISKNWALGRYDIGVFYPRADLKWLLMAENLVDQLPDDNDDKPWFTIHSLSILIKPTNIPLNGYVSFDNEAFIQSQSNIAKRSDLFEQVYRAACSKRNIPVDSVWLRWLKEAFAQAVSFLRNNMTAAMGLCLVPQFLDFFTYEEKLWSTEKFTYRKFTSVEEGFFTFFTNVSILIDSMNHSSRQFIMTPSFYTVAFEMPPKIMAYYIAVTHRLIDIYNDKDDYYGFIISPKFARELDISTLEQNETGGGDQFLTIGIGEESLYKIQHTTAVLAHEISHYVGDEHRNRGLRKRCVLMTELHNIITDLALELHNTLVHHGNRITQELGVKSSRNIPKKDAVFISWHMVDEAAASLLESLGKYVPEYVSETEKCFSRDLIVLLKYLPRHISNNPVLTQELFEFLWRSLVLNDKGTTSLGRAMSFLSLCYSGIGEIGLPEHKDDVRLLNTLVKPRLLKVFLSLLNQFVDKYESPGNGDFPRRNDICDLFSETYADLQAVLLFNLDWKSYCDLFERQDSRSQELLPPRLLAISVTLFPKAQEKLDGENPKSVFTEIKQLAENVACITDIYEKNRKLDEAELDPPLIYYLEKYLDQCAHDIAVYFKTPKIAEKVFALTSIFRAVSDEHGMYELVTNLMNYIIDYRNEVEQTLLG